MAITPLPTPPSRSDPANFADRADEFLGQLPLFGTEANALASQVNDDAVQVAADAISASESATIASGVANYQGEYNAGTTYTLGQSVSYNDDRFIAKKTNLGITPVNGVDWLQINSGNVTLTGTETLTNKTLTQPVIQEKMFVIDTATTAQKSGVYVCILGLDLTLPATPNPGDYIRLKRKTSGTVNVLRNGNNIESLAEDMEIDVEEAFITLMYADSTRGWVLI